MGKRMGQKLSRRRRSHCAKREKKTRKSFRKVEKLAETTKKKRTAKTLRRLMKPTFNHTRINAKGPKLVTLIGLREQNEENMG